ncbi:Ig-like domain-containing protein [Corallococcus sp. EGB]|uniref:Ig-like domain-containing protein n=1 Tax=Corallococcus sp. EGB TaxID=1521117 RepID=UPI001CBE4D56|nr:Ig-like domain-containing protein [Corallococcus sp. EGB]
MPHLKHLLLLSCIGLSPACIDVPPIENPPKENPADPDADFTFTAAPVQEQVLPGGTLDCNVQLAWTDTTGGAITWSLMSPPAGIELQASTLPKGETRATLSIRVGTSTAPGPYTLTLQAKSGTVTKQATLTVTVGKPGDLVVNWVVPTPGKAYTRGPLLLQFTVEGGTADNVEILKDTTVLVKPTGNPYSFTWDTTHEAEGTYQLSVRATRGGAVFTSAPRTVIVDRTAPTVASFLPAKDAATVGVHDAIQVTFSEPMNPLSVTEAAVGLKTGTGDAIPKSVALSADGRTLTVTPLSALTAPSTVQVDLTATTSALTDLAGNAATTPLTWSFSVPTWLPVGGALSAVEGKTSAEDVILKMDRNDQPVLAWVESDGLNKNVYVARWTGSTWSMLGTGLSGLAGAGTDAVKPTLTISPQNQPVVAWTEKSGNGREQILFLRQWTGDAWAVLPSAPLTTGSTQYPSSPSLAFDTNGNLFLHVCESSDNNGLVQGFSLPPSGSAWADLHPAQPSTHYHAASISVAASGNNFFTAYSTYDDTTSLRSIAVLPNNGAPLGGITLGAKAYTPSVAVDASLQPWVAWAQSDTAEPNTDGQIYWSRWNGSTWTSPLNISVNSTGNSRPSFALGTGAPHILVWSGVINTERSIFVSQWVGDSWQTLDPQLNALAAQNTPAFSPSVAMNSAAQPFIAWIEADANAASIYTVRINR